MWPFRKKTEERPKGKVVVEIPDALDPALADRKYSEPLRKFLSKNEAGQVVEISQGASNTPFEFSRILTLELNDPSVGVDLVGQFLAESGAPVGTKIDVYDAAGAVVDCLMLGP